MAPQEDLVDTEGYIILSVWPASADFGLRLLKFPRALQKRLQMVGMGGLPLEVASLTNAPHQGLLQ